MDIIRCRNNNSTRIEDIDGVKIIRMTALDKFDFVDAAFSTRIGGVSRGIYSTMNLSFSRGDRREDVSENFRRMTGALGIDVTDCVMTYQTHTTNVCVASDDYKGMGIIKDYSYKDIDGMVTDEEGLCIVTSYADCVPVFVVDPVKRAIGACHSGWKGTVGNITHNMIELLKERYGSKPEDLTAIIGPSICRTCYEVSKDVADRFYEAYTEYEAETILTDKGDGKYLLDLHEANRYNLKNEGIHDENISITDMCTGCNPDVIFSHRKSGGQRGGMCGFIWIKKA